MPDFPTETGGPSSRSVNAELTRLVRLAVNALGFRCAAICEDRRIRASAGLEGEMEAAMCVVRERLVSSPRLSILAEEGHFFVAMPICSATDVRLGTLLVCDSREHTVLSPGERSCLGDIADLAATLLAPPQPHYDHFRFIFERAADAVGVSHNGVHVFVNQAYCQLFGCDSPADVIGHSVLELIAPEERDRIQQIVTGRSHGRSVPISYETKGLRLDGAVFDMEVHASVYGLAGVRYILVSLNDITERNAAAEQLRRANETLRALIQASPVAIVAFDSSGRVTLWNSTAERLFGWTEQEALEGLPHFVPPQNTDEYEMIRSLNREGIGLTNFEVPRLRKDGTVIDVAVSTAPMRDWTGTVSGMMAVYVDISDRKRMEQKLADAQKMEAVGRLAGGIAHDFNNLLTIISGYTQAMLDAAVAGDPARETIQEILLASQRAAKLTNQLLTFSRRQILQTQPVALDEQVSGMENLLRRTIGEHIKLETVLRADAPLIIANAGQIEQVIMNLAINARDAMPGGGTLTIEVGAARSEDVQAWEPVPVRPGLYGMLAVHDSGHGIDRDTIGRIFEPFFTTKEQGKGTGLGLATVYGIVKQHGGYIGVESEAGRHTVFRVYLPAARQSRKAVVTEEPAAPRRGHETILVVEDEISLKRLVRGMLSGEGYTVLDAETGEEALRLAQAHHGSIDLLLSDVVMPGMGGPELARRLVALRPRLKVAFMSGYMDHAVSREILAGHGWFLEKPFTKTALLRLVRDVLDRQG